MRATNCAGCNKEFDYDKRGRMVAAIENGEIVRIYCSTDCVNRTEYLIDLSENDFEPMKSN